MSHFLNPSVSIPKRPFPTLEEWARLTNLCKIILLSHYCGTGTISSAVAKMEAGGWAECWGGGLGWGHQV